MRFSFAISVSSFQTGRLLSLVLLSLTIMFSVGARAALADGINLSANGVGEIFSQADLMLGGDNSGIGFVCGPKECANLDVTLDSIAQTGTMTIDPVIAPSANPVVVILCYLAGRKLLQEAGKIVVTAGITWALNKAKDGIVSVFSSAGAPTGSPQPAPVCMPLSIGSPIFQAVTGVGPNGGTYSSGGFTIVVGPLRQN
ncbi:MAG: hypothetical protein K1X79_10545 [Oligoflexia bacterium]|nr:hypothetical protein [Oligoflexia bacterium]